MTVKIKVTNEETGAVMQKVSGRFALCIAFDPADNADADLAVIGCGDSKGEDVKSLAGAVVEYIDALAGETGVSESKLIALFCDTFDKINADKEGTIVEVNS